MKIEIEGYGEFEVQDNFANLPEDKQQEIANELIKAKQLSKNINIPVSTTQGIIDSALQGLSFGFSDEIAGFFDEDAKENIRKRLRSFRSSNPALAIGSEIAGSLPTSILGGAGLAKAGFELLKLLNLFLMFSFASSSKKPAISSEKPKDKPCKALSIMP